MATFQIPSTELRFIILGYVIWSIAWDIDTLEFDEWSYVPHPDARLIHPIL
jgi:hypothetical protein